MKHSRICCLKSSKYLFCVYQAKLLCISLPLPCSLNTNIFIQHIFELWKIIISQLTTGKNLGKKKIPLMHLFQEYTIT